MAYLTNVVPPMKTVFPDLPRQTRYAFRLRQTLRCGFWYRPAGLGDVNTRCQGDYSVIYVLMGGGTYRDAIVDTTFGPGDVIQRFPDCPREILFSGVGEVLQLSMGVPRSVYDLLVLGGVPDATNPVLRVGLHTDLVNQGERILADLRELPDHRLYETIARMHRLLAEIHRLAARDSRCLRPEVEAVCAILEDDFQRPINLPDLAARLNLSYTTFRRIFAAQMGVSPGEYRLRRRTEYVQELLCDPQLSIAEIAARAGYRDAFALSRQFRQRTGVSPRRFRELYG
jgi:AraC-like DNA-binding protein